jgi:N-acetylneuraminic acid mutarotase
MRRSPRPSLPALAALLAVAAAACTPPAYAPHDAGSGPGAWSTVRPLDQRRFEAAAATLGGKVYFFGGISDLCPDGAPACTVDRVDVYDPASDSWSPAPPLPAGAPRHHLALAVVGGTWDLVGGFVGILGSAQPFTPVAATFAFDGSAWTRRADAPAARGAATAQAIGGLVYVAGGGTGEPSALATLAVYDPVADRWDALAPMPTAREHVASCVLDGEMVVIGGWHDGQSVTDAVEAYDPVRARWRALAPLPTARGGLGAAIAGGVCYAAGGEEWSGPDPGTFADVQGLASVDGQWGDFAPLVHARHGVGVTALDGIVYVIGGGPSRGNSYTNEVDSFSP